MSEETLSHSGESIIILGSLSPSSKSKLILVSLSPSGRIIYTPTYESISLSSKAFDLLKRDFHQALGPDLLSSLSDWMSLTRCRCDS